jgi:hypothetical protein
MRLLFDDIVTREYNKRIAVISFVRDSMPAVIREQTIAGERVLHLGPTILVASGSQPGAWYAIEDGRCTCPGFSYRQTCRHLGPARLAAELDRANAVPVAAVAQELTAPACSRCGATKRRLLTQEMVCSPCLETEQE